ncbi:hypothetical protein GCK72_012552 [Caenorhabditis remanei]|uniref:Uncharacterized protein n=1 Tax=Caenorhabditis remanei TaxID=31234 RepID=A0A6A5GNU5_CAERE|nr:hypothetical protein GCK72_012552 [Caenorhabditis remanei]KAF1756099.1 hypothetical protein GCK72_012552 [Caenorhabditis remanei]
MSVEISDWFDDISLSVKFDFMGRHHFLDNLSDVTETNVDSRFLDSSIGGLTNRLDEWIEFRVEVNGESGVDKTSTDVDTVIDLANISILKDSRITRVWCVVSGTVIERASSWEGESRFESLLLDETARCRFEAFAGNWEVI